MNNLFSKGEISVNNARKITYTRFLSESCYRAFLVRRLFRITPNDFLTQARRFVALCDKFYQGSKVKLIQDKFFFEDFPGNQIDLRGLTEESFQKIFFESLSLKLVITPKKFKDSSLKDSFAHVRWINYKERALFFYAQGGRDLVTGQNRFFELLFRKMFYVRGVPPNLLYSVRYGIDNHMKMRREFEF